MVFDKKCIADMLQNQFKGVFSCPKEEFNVSFEQPKILYPLPDLEITKTNVIKAINKMKSSSSCPKNEIPARVFKECKMTLWVPLQMLWNVSFDAGIVPEQYKSQQIIPIYKKGSKVRAENSRPISLTSHTIKIFERILRDKLVFYFESNSLFSQNQHGFRNKRGCATQLLSHTYSIFSSLVDGDSVDCIYIDYAKAFDKVDHNILIKKLNHYGVNCKYINWIQSFLQGRSQTVFVNTESSYPTPVKSGVPQGSVLGPLLFIIYINDLSHIIKGSKLLTFADDTKIISRIHTANDTNILQKNLHLIIKWSQNNNMELNNKKFELVTHKSDLNHINLKLFEHLPFYNKYTTYLASDSVVIQPSAFAKDLGILVDEALNWKLQVDTVSKKASRFVPGCLVCSLHVTKQL